MIKLNKAQQEAVDHIYGPLLVLAGPGTGKTQLLSSRVANILSHDNSPSNILCLTFTEAAAHNMRDRLKDLIGQDAYSVHISTYHSFGSDIIRNYPEYFQKLETDRSDDSRLERPVDELTQIQILTAIVDKLTFDDPLLGSRYYVKSLLSTISDMKKWGIGPDDLNTIADDNQEQIDKIKPSIDEIVNDRGGFSRKKEPRQEQFAQLLEVLTASSGDLLQLAANDLAQAYVNSEAQSSSTPLTKWKDSWLPKDTSGQHTLTDPMSPDRLRSLSRIYQAYDDVLHASSLYDFDDMILKSIDALKENDDLRYNLQERYQYILLDEFQDTNGSQFELVNLIASHPVNESSPNIMAVGDDDQGIYAFQGADTSNMLRFINSYTDTKVINLKETYRSHPDIVDTAHNVSAQIESRLHKNLPGISKTLKPAGTALSSSPTIERREFDGVGEEHTWIASRIRSLIDSGTEPDQISVLSPRHAQLESLVPYLVNENIPVAYEKRENILETPIIEGLRLASELTIALKENNRAEANRLMPIVLSLPHWDIPVASIWQTNWQLASKDSPDNWPEIALENDDLTLPVLFLLSVSQLSATEPLEHILDYLIGTAPVSIDGEEVFSPLKEYYCSPDVLDTEPLTYYESISHLSVVRSKIRDYQLAVDNKLTIHDFISFISLYSTAEARLLNTNPISTNDSAVSLMTAYKAKGLEFEHVFILSAQDDVWGSTVRSPGNKLSLPPNLKHIRYGGQDEDDRIRLLFVAITRAKFGLYITSYKSHINGKLTTPVKYLDEREGRTHVLPKLYQVIETTRLNPSQINRAVETDWITRHTVLDATLKSLLKDRLRSYKMSPTHLNTYVDLEYGGPQSLLLYTLLRFPRAPSASGEYGTAIHNTLEWFQNSRNQAEKATVSNALTYFDRELSSRYLTHAEIEDYSRRGKKALELYLEARVGMFNGQAFTEVNFSTEGVVVGDAVLSGKIDRIEIDEENKSLRIVDYKTGKPHTKWDKEMSMLKYEQQLYLYKILIEGSNTYSSYKVESARLEFIEPGLNGDIVPALEISFDSKKEADIKHLVGRLWSDIQSLDFADTDKWPADYAGSLAFITSLLER